MHTIEVNSDLRIEVRPGDPPAIYLVSDVGTLIGDPGQVQILDTEIDNLQDALEDTRLLLHKLERHAADTGLVCALCGGPIRTTLAADWVRACHNCGIEEGPMVPADDSADAT
jgi:hypothetical protein